MNPRAVYWMDMTFFHIDLQSKCIVCLNRPKINEKYAGVSPFKKNPKFTNLQSFIGPDPMLLCVKVMSVVNHFHLEARPGERIN